MGELIFIKVLNMSLTGSFVILAVLVMRLFLRRVPRIFSYCLWGVVLFRLLCPVSFTAGFSLLGALEQPAISQGRMVYIPEELAMAGSQAGRQADAGNVLLADGADNKEGTNVGKGVLTATGIWERIFLPGDGVNVALWAGARIWILGICVMAGYSLLTLMGLKRKLRGARWEEGDIYVTKEVPMPFVIGLVKPRIYLPETLEEREKSYVLLHEQIHIRRRDHVVKILAFLALCIHWFNPFVWVAFFLSEKDMEMSCDEAVIRRIGSDVKKAYTASLLGMATGGHVVRGVPLAFGEGDTGSRIRNVLRYRKPAAMAVAVTAVGCAVAALVLLANPAKDKEKLKQEVYYGVVSDILIEGNAQRVIQIPGWWDVADIPEADSVSVYFEREEQELLPGDMVQITFPAGEEVTVMETWPVMFAQKAESIVVLWGGLSLECTEGDTYRVTFAAGVVPGYETAKPGDILSIYWEEGDPEAPAYLSWVPEGENSVLVAQVPLLGAGEFSDGIRRFTVELTAEQIQRVFEGFGFHIRFALEQGVPAGRDGQPEEAEAGMDGTGDVYLTGTGSTGTGTGSTGAGNTGSGDIGAGSVSVEDADGAAEVYVEELGRRQAFWKGTHQVYVKSVSRSARVIDSYVTAGGDVQSEPELAFSKDCVFQANYSMSGADYREISFEEFADFIAEGRRPRGRQAVEKSCHLTFQNGLIVEAALDSIWYPYGIGFSTYTLQNDQHKFLMSQEGTEALEQNYILDSEEKVDISDREGMETIEVYVGDLGDGDSGIVLCRDAQGNLLSSQDAHVTRAGWNNIYVGEVAEGAFLLNVSIEDKWYSGEYGYWVYRLNEEGELKQIAGSTFVFDIMDNSLTEYDDELFREWVDGMTVWLEDSHLLLATQGGELRTEKICEADRYCYETLGLKDRLEE